MKSKSVILSTREAHLTISALEHLIHEYQGYLRDCPSLPSVEEDIITARGVIAAITKQVICQTPTTTKE